MGRGQALVIGAEPWPSGSRLQQLLGARLHGEPRILLRLGPRDRRNALDEVEHALGQTAFFGQHRLDDLAGLRLGEAALAQEISAVLIAARDDPLACGADALDEGLRRGVGEVGERWRRFMREAVGGIFGMPDTDPLEVLDAPQVAVLADGAEIETRDTECLRAHLGVPAIKAAEEQVGRAIGQRARLDRVHVVDQEEEDVAVRGVERRGVLGDVDHRIVDAGRPVEHTRDLPARVADAIACDTLHGRDQLMIVDAAIVRTGDGAQLGATVGNLHRLDLFRAVIGEAVLQVDARKRRGELAQIGRRRADEACELAEAPMGRRNGCVRIGQNERELLGIVAMGLDADRGALDRPRLAPLGPALHRGVEVREREVLLVIGPGKPFGRNPPFMPAAGHIHLVAAALGAAVNDFDCSHG